MYTWKVDAQSIMTNAKARIVARGLSQVELGGERLFRDIHQHFFGRRAQIAYSTGLQFLFGLSHFDDEQAFILSDLDSGPISDSPGVMTPCWVRQYV